MTALDEAAEIRWAESDTLHYAALTAAARTTDSIDWVARLALFQAAKHSPAGVSLIVRGVRAAILVREAELLTLATAKHAGYEEWFAALAAARIDPRPTAPLYRPVCVTDWTEQEIEIEDASIERAETLYQEDLAAWETRNPTAAAALAAAADGQATA